MFGKILFTIGLVATGLLLVLFNLTTPSNAGAIGILCAFLLAYTAILSLTTFVLYGAVRVVTKLAREAKHKGAVKSLSIRKAYYYASVIALAPVILVSLQSVGGAGIYEIGLICLFVVLGCIYIARRTN